MGHKRKPARQPSHSPSSSSSFCQPSEQERSRSSLSRSSGSASSGRESSGSFEEDWKMAYRRLSKRQLRKLVDLERKISREEAILRRMREKTRPKSAKKRPENKKQPRSPTPTPTSKQQPPSPTRTALNEPPESRKLFITGIPTQHSHEKVSSQLSKLLLPIPRVTGFRVKRKEGSATYAFVDFDSIEDARQAREMLKKRKIFGEKVVVYYSLDDRKEKGNGSGSGNGRGKQCFQCQGYGHFARECQYKRYAEAPDTREQQQSKQQEQEQEQERQEEFDDMEQRDQGPYVKLQENYEEKPVSKRVIRDKFRLSRLLGQN